jgi:ABC-type transporter Mla subunit MlaD
MADLPPDPDFTPGTPRWVKVFGIIAAVVVLLFVILLIAGGGQHGPGRHTRSGHAPPVQHP